MQRILLLGLLFAQAALCNAALETQLENLLEDASLLLHNLTRQHLLWQCNATKAPSDVRSLASCQQATHGKPVMLKLPTAESLAGLLAQLATTNGAYNEVRKAIYLFRKSDFIRYTETFAGADCDRIHEARVKRGAGRIFP